MDQPCRMSHMTIIINIAKWKPIILVILKLLIRVSWFKDENDLLRTKEKLIRSPRNTKPLPTKTILRNTFACKWPNCLYSVAHRSNVIRHIKIVHFKIPQNKKKQNLSNTEDQRDPNEYVEVNTELLNREIPWVFVAFFFIIIFTFSAIWECLNRRRSQFVIIKRVFCNFMEFLNLKLSPHYCAFFRKSCKTMFYRKHYELVRCQWHRAVQCIISILPFTASRLSCNFLT